MYICSVYFSGEDRYNLDRGGKCNEEIIKQNEWIKSYCRGCDILYEKFLKKAMLIR